MFTRAPNPGEPDRPLSDVRTDLVWRCPGCGGELISLDSDRKSCPEERQIYSREQGIWRFLTPDRAARYERFSQDYLTVRKAEGRGSHDPEYYRAFPFPAASGKFRREWRIRAKTYEAFVREVLTGKEDAGRRLEVLDLGAGNCWFSNRIRMRGHHPTAVDLLVDAEDGLGAHRHYQTTFRVVQAEFDRLHFAGGQFDLVVFNASLHYSTDYELTLNTAMRQLKPDGLLVVMDSPIYRDPASGNQMVRERAELFQSKYGLKSDSLPSKNFLTLDQLEYLASVLGIHWRFIKPRYGLAWALRPWTAKLQGRREPATFLLLVTSR